MTTECFSCGITTIRTLDDGLCQSCHQKWYAMKHSREPHVIAKRNTPEARKKHRALCKKYRKEHPEVNRRASRAYRDRKREERKNEKHNKTA